MATASCFICGKLFEPEESRAMPFCSDRCRQIDLGRWLSEGYAVPEPPREDGEPDEAGDADGLPRSEEPE
jgi:uncharacterized protein